MIRLARLFSLVAAKKSAPNLSHELVNNFLQAIEQNSGRPAKFIISTDQQSKNRNFNATLQLPLPNDLRNHFETDELAISGIGKSHADAKREAKINTVIELYETLKDKIAGLPPTLINRVNEIDLTFGVDALETNTSNESRFDNYEDALNFLTNLYSRMEMSVPVAVALQLPNHAGWKASLLGYLPKKFTISGIDECVRSVAIGDSQEASKKTARIGYANQIYPLLSSSESYLPKNLQNDSTKEAEERNSKLATALISLTEEEAKKIESFLDCYKEEFNNSPNEAKRIMRSALYAFPSPSCYAKPGKCKIVREELTEYPRKDLPIHEFYKQIIQSIDSNDVTLITGATGSGKTTQLPQFIFTANEKNSMENPHIIMTQPRRIAAIAAATRIAQETGQELGRDCNIGYAVRFETVKPTHMRNGSLNVCTSGVLLKRLQADPNLSGITHVLIDEVHERDVTTDVLLLCLRQLLQNRRGSVKVVFMSATLVANKIAEYFSSKGYSVGIPFDISGTNFPVQVNYLDNISPLNKLPQFNKNVLRISPQLENDTNEFVQNELIGKVLNEEEEDIPYALIFRLILNICLNEPLGSILVFLPGIEDLNLMKDLLLGQHICDFHSSIPKCKLFLLHAGLGITSEMSNELFVPHQTPKPYRKVILATNVAESSVTVPDAVYVIDSARHRVLKYDHAKRMSVLATEWISKANVKQRKGRAGRCRAGMYYFIGSKDRFNSLPADNPPEISRVNLESTCLTIRKIFPVASLNATFSQLIEPPLVSNIRDAISRLQTLDALDENEQLCPLGDVMASFSVDPSYAKVLILGCLFKCLDPILTIVASTGERIFSIGLSDFDKQTINKWIFWYASETRTQQHPFSDHLALCSIVNEYEKLTNDSERFAFCLTRKLMFTTMRRIVANKRNFFRSLQQSGFVQTLLQPRYDDPLLNVNSGNTHLIRTLLLMGVFPNVAFRIGSKKNHFKTKLLSYASIPLASGNCQLSETKYGSLKDTVDHDDFVELKGSDYPQFWLFDSVLKTSFRPILNRITAISPLSLLLITDATPSSRHNFYRSIYSNSSQPDTSCSDMAVGNVQDQVLFVDDWIQIKIAKQNLLLAIGLKDLLDRFIDWRVRNVIERIYDPSSIDSQFLDQLCSLFDSIFTLTLVKDEKNKEK